MAFNKLKDKLSELAGNETLGSAEVDEKEEVKMKPKKTKKAARLKNPSAPSPNSKLHDYGDVLAVLGINSTSNVDVIYQAKDLDYIQFTQTTPLGFDFDEVADFIAKTKSVVSTYERELEKRDNDVQKLAQEVRKIEQRMIEQRQEEQLNMMMGEVSEEERLLQENVELKMEIEELQRKLRLLSNSNTNTQKLEREVQALRAENEVLRQAQAEFTTIEDKVIEEKLPKFPPVGQANSMPPLVDDTQDILDELLMDNETEEPNEDPIDEMLFNIKKEFK